MVAESLFTVPATVSFPEAIALTQTLLDHMEQGTLTDTAVVAAVTALVHSETGARGFFVTYLSDDRALADHLVLSMTEALRSAPTVVAPLLVKNLVMSTAMAITHRRNQDEMAANGSEGVRSRTAQLIQALQLPQVQENAQALASAIDTGDGAYQTFLQRWGYDAEQKQAMRQVLEANGLLEPRGRTAISGRASARTKREPRTRVLNATHVPQSLAEPTSAPNYQSTATNDLAESK